MAVKTRNNFDTVLHTLLYYFGYTAAWRGVILFINITAPHPRSWNTDPTIAHFNHCTSVLASCNFRLRVFTAPRFGTLRYYTFCLCLFKTFAVFLIRGDLLFRLNTIVINHEQILCNRLGFRVRYIVRGRTGYPPTNSEFHSK